VIEDSPSSVPKPYHNLLRFKEDPNIPADDILSWKEYLQEHGVSFLIGGVSILTISVLLIYLWKIPAIRRVFPDLPAFRVQRFRQPPPEGPTFQPLRTRRTNRQVRVPNSQPSVIREVEFRSDNAIAMF
jgi:hypothetical protein